jgi:hypothetical protein
MICSSILDTFSVHKTNDSFLFCFSDLLSSKLLQLCEFAYENSADAVSSRALVQDETIIVPLEKDGDLMQLELTVNFLLNSTTPLPVYADADEVQRTQDIPLPDLYPIKHTVTLEKENIYQTKNIFRKF